jgi:pyruvate formate lyase activating enzyme
LAREHGAMTGTIFDIKRFAMHDGPGIRTTVFLKGCPLHCTWCHNPESQPSGTDPVDGKNGPTPVGRTVSVDEVIAVVERDTAFYDESGGGVTFSGGEPLAQPDFLARLLDRCGEREIHRAVDTSGYAPRATLLRIARRTDLFLYDLKLADAADHAAQVGGSVGVIWDNLRALCDAGAAVEIRFPVVPGITDGEANVAALGRFAASLPRLPAVWLLPYHRAAMDKYRRFGLTPPLPDTREPTEEAMARIAAALKAMGLEVRR